MGIAAAQLVHAAGESTIAQSGMWAVVLEVADEQALTDLARALLAAGVAHVPIIEPDRNNEMTAIGVVPARRSTLRKHFAGLRLYGATGR